MKPLFVEHFEHHVYNKLITSPVVITGSFWKRDFFIAAKTFKSKLDLVKDG